MKQLLLLALLIVTACAKQEPSIRIRAYIDGSDELIISQDSIYWNHLSKAAVGRHYGNNEPTTISLMKRDAAVDSVIWFPEWSSPPPAEIRRRESSSSFVLPLEYRKLFTPEKLFNLEPSIVGGRGRVSLNRHNANGTVSIGILFDDIPESGPEWYTIDLIPADQKKVQREERKIPVVEISTKIESDGNTEPVIYRSHITVDGRDIYQEIVVK